MCVFWMILPQLMAAAFKELYKKMSAAQDPMIEAVRMGRQLTDDIRKQLKE